MPGRDDDPGERRLQRALRRATIRSLPTSSAVSAATRDTCGRCCRTLDALAGGAFADLDSARREAVADRLRETGGLALKMLTRIILQCYYRDDRVMRSLDMEVRPPFPIGFELEQGDWSLLDPVRVRPKLYREVS